jgi:hypothetical protein
MWNSFGMFQSTSNSASSGGGKYKPILRFDWDVLNHHPPDSIETLPEYSHTALLNIIEDYPEFKSEQILKMTIYKHKLEENWLNYVPYVEDYRFHSFIVFKTKDWFYSIEKFMEKVGFQRSRELRGRKQLSKLRRSIVCIFYTKKRTLI